jgi:hypothetical protein
MTPRGFDLGKNLLVAAAAIALLVLSGSPAFCHWQNADNQFSNSNYVTVASQVREGSFLWYVSTATTVHSDHQVTLSNNLDTEYTINVTVFLYVEDQDSPGDNFDLPVPPHDFSGADRDFQSNIFYDSTDTYDSSAGTSSSTAEGVSVYDPHYIQIVL